MGSGLLQAHLIRCTPQTIFYDIVPVVLHRYLSLTVIQSGGCSPYNRDTPKTNRINNEMICKLPDRQIPWRFFLKRLEGQQMKKLYTTLIVLFLITSKSFATMDYCVTEAYRTAYTNYENNKKHQQKFIPNDNIDYIKPEHFRREKELRYLCFEELEMVDTNCYAYKCFTEHQTNTNILPLRINPDINPSETCNILSTDDCLNGDITSLEEKLRHISAEKSMMYFTNINELIAKIEFSSNSYSGNILQKTYDVCYATDDNKDTIWHAIARRKTSLFEEKCTKDCWNPGFNAFEGSYDEDCLKNNCINESEEQLLSWIKTCFDETEYSENKTAELHRSMFLKQNNQGKTAIAEAIENNTLYRFSKIIEYFKSKNMDYKNILKAAAEEANISYSKLSKALEKGKEIKTKKEVTF